MAFFHLHAEFILHANGLGGVWRRKRRERLAWTEKKVVGSVPSGVGKSDVWLVVAKTVKARQLIVAQRKG